jgi:hypothetical protein
MIQTQTPATAPRPKISRTRKAVWAAAAVAVIVLIIAALTYYYINNTSSSLSLNQLQTPMDQSDLNWGGYSVAYNFSDPKPLVTGVSGSWVVPQVQISQNDTFSAIWVGIDGFFGHTLIQTGTEQDCVGGIIQYSAWYELLPSDAVTIDTMEVSPGDKITASISLENPLGSIWSIRINDLSTGQSFSQNFPYSSNKLSAEWIVERPDVNNALSKIADFGSVTLSDCKVTMDNEVGAFGYFPSVRIFMYDTNGTRLADVSDYSNDGASFTVQYLT